MGAVYDKVRTPQAGENQILSRSRSTFFDVVAREWHCQWIEDNDKQSLRELQAFALKTRETLLRIPGVVGVYRIVCGECKEFKIITCVRRDCFADWEANDFKPELSCLQNFQAIPGVHAVETQTYEWMTSFDNYALAIDDEMVAIASGVEYNAVAREIRCKWSRTHNQASLPAMQKVFESNFEVLEKIDGVLGLHRTVCSNNLECKILIVIRGTFLSAWEELNYAPCENIKAALSDAGATDVEDRLYTMMTL